MNRPIGRLCRNVLIQGIPSYALHIMIVFGNLAYNRACLSIIDACNVIHAASDKEDAVRRPRQIIYFRSNGPAHGLDSPCLLIFEAFFEVGMRSLVVSRNPEEHVAIIASACNHFASWTPSHHVDGLCVLHKGGEVGDLPLFAGALHAPEANIVIAAGGRQSALAMGFKVGRIYRCVLVVPGHQQRSGLHRE